MTPSVAAPGVTHPSDATGRVRHGAVCVLLLRLRDAACDVKAARTASAPADVYTHTRPIASPGVV